MPDAPGLELIAQEIGDAHEGAILGTYHEHGQACLIVNPEQIRDILAWLRDTPGQEYDFLASVHGVDYLPAEPRFGVHYELLNRSRVERLRVRAALADPAASNGKAHPTADPAAPGGEAEEAGGTLVESMAALPVIDSCTDMFPAAELQEREVYDFFGIVFRGHPDLRRILLPEAYVGWPHRRDFPVGGEPVIFTHNERQVPGWSQ